MMAWLVLWAVASLLPAAVAVAQEEEEKSSPFARRGFYMGFGAVLAVDTFEDEYRKPKYHSNDIDDEDNILSTDKEGGSRIEDPRTRARLRPQWVMKWLRNPQHVQPGTKMPTFQWDGAGMDRIWPGVSAETRIPAVKDLLFNLDKMSDNSLTKPLK